MLKLLSLRWLGYHVTSLIEILFSFHPFRIFTYKIPIIFRPGISAITFLFAFFCLLIILLPIVIVVATYFNIQQWAFAPLIATAFGVVFSIIFKNVTNGAIVKITYDGHRILFTTFGLFEKTVEPIPMTEVKGVSLYTDQTPRSKNYKICLLLTDHRTILLRVSKSKSRSKRRLEKVGTALNLSTVPYPKGTIPINDISLGNAREAYEH